MYLYLGSVRPGGARARYSCSLYILQFFKSFVHSIIRQLSVVSDWLHQRKV